MDYASFQELAELVDEHDGLYVTTAVKLRDVAQWQRLTSGAIEEIDNNLVQHALGYYPDISPGDRFSEVRVYRRGLDVGNVIEAVLDPTEHGDKLLREAATGGAAETVRSIRRMVCE